MNETVKADPGVIQMWAKRTRCAMCKHRKEEGHILPKGKFYPSPAWLFHYEDTHGFPHDMLYKYIWNSVYGLPNELKDIAGGQQ